MEIIVKTYVLMDKDDYVDIRRQLKELKIKVVNICKRFDLSRTYFYEMISGKRYLSKEMLTYFKEIGIKIKMGGIKSGIN